MTPEERMEASAQAYAVCTARHMGIAGLVLRQHAGGYLLVNNVTGRCAFDTSPQTPATLAVALDYARMAIGMERADCDPSDLGWPYRGHEFGASS